MTTQGISRASLIQDTAKLHWVSFQSLPRHLNPSTVPRRSILHATAESALNEGAQLPARQAACPRCSCARPEQAVSGEISLPAISGSGRPELLWTSEDHERYSQRYCTLITPRGARGEPPNFERCAAAAAAGNSRCCCRWGPAPTPCSHSPHKQCMIGDTSSRSQPSSSRASSSDPI